MSADPAPTISEALTNAVTAHPVAAVVVLDGRVRLMVTRDEAASLLGVNRDQISEWIKDGSLRALNLHPGGGQARYRISVQSLLDLANRGTP